MNIKRKIGNKLIDIGLSMSVCKKSNLVSHAKFELEYNNRKNKLSGTENLYVKGIECSIMNLIKLFSSQGHSGLSADITLSIFDKLARFKPLSGITSNPDEWMKVTDKLYQNKRCGSCFSDDDLKTYYDIDDDNKIKKSLEGEQK